MESGGETVNEVRIGKLCKDFLKASERLHEMKQRLVALGDSLSFEGEPYPGPGEIREDDLKRFTQWMRNKAAPDDF